MRFIKKLVLVLTLVLTVFLTLACGEEATLKFEKNSFEVTVGESFELKPIITGSESLVEYSFDKEGIVKIENQTVSALAAGSVVITANLKDARKVNATIIVVVKKHYHVYDQTIAEDEYLASKATCTAKAKYYKSCICGSFDENQSEKFNIGTLAAHVYDKEVVDPKYLAEEATAESAAKYYKSCVCGEFDEELSEIFIYGDTTQDHIHVYEEVVKNRYLKTGATCTAKATYYKSCVCGEKSEETFEAGDYGQHIYDKQVVDNKYLKSSATCTEPATYYLSCECGMFDTEISKLFYFGELEPHVYSNEVIDEKYLATKATCREEATYYKSCICGAYDVDESYTFIGGELEPHVYNEVADEKYLVSKATCTQKAKYYKSCECGDINKNETFEAGDFASHIYNQTIVDEKYLAKEATCIRRALYYKSCVCGHFYKNRSLEFEAGGFGEHKFIKEIVSYKYLASEATENSPATYYKSCTVCGEKGTETFEYGEPLSKVTEIKMNIVKTELSIGEKVGYYIDIMPTHASNKDYDIILSDGNIVSVNKESETITAIGLGSCTITITSLEDSNIKHTISITVKEKTSEKINIDFISIIGDKEMRVGEKMSLTAIVNPYEAFQSVTWELYETNIATISEDGVITALATGTIRVRAISVSENDGGQKVKSNYFIIKVYE